MLMIALNLYHIHVSPLVRRLTTTQTSAHLIAFTSCGHYLPGCHHHFVTGWPKILWRTDQCQRYCDAR